MAQVTDLLDLCMLAKNGSKETDSLPSGWGASAVLGGRKRWRVKLVSGIEEKNFLYRYTKQYQHNKHTVTDTIGAQNVPLYSPVGGETMLHPHDRSSNPLVGKHPL